MPYNILAALLETAAFVVYKVPSDDLGYQYTRGPPFDSR